MAHTAAKTASILTDLYAETFSEDSFEPFRITWTQLRSIARVTCLTDYYLRKINRELNKANYAVTAYDNFLVVARESDMTHFRSIPDRLVEQCLDIDEDDDVELDDNDVEGCVSDDNARESQ
jgi:hypothetical protein